jgi:hypothetical protein
LIVAMIDPCRVALALVAGVFLPNVVSGVRSEPACDAKAPPILSAERRASLPAGDRDVAKTTDDRLADLASSAPGGFAGAYLDSSSAAAGTAKPKRLIVRLSRPQERDSALRAILPRLRGIYGEDVDRGGVVTASARLDLAQLRDWRRYLEPHANAVAKVTATAIDQPHNRISYKVASRADRDALVQHLGELHLPCGLVDVVIA